MLPASGSSIKGIHAGCLRNGERKTGSAWQQPLLHEELNPEPIAELWEGKWNDGLRITPSIRDRLAASAKTQDMGFEIRWRVDPILPVDNWAEIYREFLFTAAAEGHRPTRITLGTYREMGRSLLTMADKWDLLPMEFIPGNLAKDGMHYHIPERQRIEIYQQLVDFIKSAWQSGTFNCRRKVRMIVADQ